MDICHFYPVNKNVSYSFFGSVDEKIVKAWNIVLRHDCAPLKLGVFDSSEKRHRTLDLSQVETFTLHNAPVLCLSFFMTNKRDSWKYFAVLALVPFFIGFGYLVTSDYKTIDESSSDVEVETSDSVQTPPVEEVFPHKIPPRSSLYAALRELNVTPVTIQEIVGVAKPFVNLSRLKPGTRFRLVYSDPSSLELSSIKFRFSPVEILELTRGAEGWTARKVDVDVETRVITFRGIVKSSLWESAIAAEMDPNLTAELAEIFAWQVDFAREVQVNDRWRLSVEQKLVNGRPYGWGRILAAEYENVGQLHSAVLFRSKGKDLGYFAPDGSSLKRMFLKSPIKFGRISSRFQRRRFHPVLRVHRPHLGVDYAAPRGTPVRAVGDGTVIIAGRRGGAGKMIKIRHNSVYKTAYKHLHGYARGIRRGAKVKQGQIIGYVGSTGLSTGPHLHFEFYKHGRFVDPLGQTFPSADPVPSDLLSQFKAKSPQALASLPKWESVDVSLREPASEQMVEEKVESL